MDTLRLPFSEKISCQLNWDFYIMIIKDIKNFATNDVSVVLITICYSISITIQETVEKEFLLLFNPHYNSKINMNKMT